MDESLRRLLHMQQLSEQRMALAEQGNAFAQREANYLQVQATAELALQIAEANTLLQRLAVALEALVAATRSGTR